ncbi:hypothetical protein HH214_13225 [Mucilaginibacter robiniae]|uniref:Uncharacterized protein n=1 Tax=Mucilaginibacter robiniae TaxID=2728022 RepID=A0A7L5E068_9SPHI|nr:hypothetical protein [Mucilaginibacter robiniae]QJD96762.1 hypothetical protein HH214_13225 [Mucilaginibacter robiniae]
MKSLSTNWFIEGRVDFEYKKYVLLDYLQEINRYFSSNQLYPNLSDLVLHYNNLLDFKKHKTLLQQNFSQRLSKADIDAVKLTYQKIVQDDYTMQEIEQIITYALRKMDPTLKNGRELYDFVESRLDIDTIGLVPLQPCSGYFTLRNGKETTNWVYEYQVTLFEGKDDNYRGINIKLIDTYEQSLVNTPESVKQNLIKQHKHLPNPAMYYVKSDMTFPLEQTLLPIAKRSLVKYISAAA